MEIEYAGKNLTIESRKIFLEQVAFKLLLPAPAGGHHKRPL